jgi:diguanylate cyclase (GGDEF)-like protein/PAS domain S-box-containing protein
MSTEHDAEIALLQVLLDASLDAAIRIDSSGLIQGWNQQAESLFGWPRVEVMGRAFYDVVLPQRYRARLISAFARAQTPTLSSVRLETAGLHRLGHELAIELTLTMIKTNRAVEYCAFFRDLSVRHQMERDLLLAQSSFESVEGMLILDADLSILKVNVAFSGITGYSATEAIGKKSSIIRLNQPDLRAFWEIKNRSPADMFWRGEVQDRRKNGETYPVKLSVMAVANESGHVSHFVLAFVDLSESRQSEDRLHRLSFYDALTELPNRMLMLDRLQQALISSERNQSHGAVLLIDLDDFKNLNDAMEHKIGDQMLIQVTQRLKGCLYTTDTLARLGGDEFVVILEELDAQSSIAAEKAEIVANRIIETFSEPFDLKGHSHPASAGIGICLFKGLAVEPSALVTRAETAMHHAKEVKYNAIRFFDAATQATLQTRFTLTEWMRQGLPQQFALHYQIQTSSQGVPFGAEALIRWQHPEQGHISPALFIPLAEETGLIIQIGAWVLRRACEQLVLWSHRSAMQHLTLSVNVSPKQFHQSDFVQQVIDALEQTGANPARLELELTEGMMVRDVNAVIEKMLILKRHGVRFSLDDFGTGYSSLSYLKRFPIDQLKIDQSFVQSVLDDPHDAAIVRAVITLGQSLGMAVIAEGVESSAQCDFLRANGCKEFQGYLFGRPLAVAAFEALVEQKEPIFLSALALD